MDKVIWYYEYNDDSTAVHINYIRNSLGGKRAYINCKNSDQTRLIPSYWNGYYSNTIHHILLCDLSKNMTSAE